MFTVASSSTYARRSPVRCHPRGGGDGGVVCLETAALARGGVGAVVVDQHYLVLVVRIVVVGNAFEYVIDVLFAVIGANDDGNHC